MSHRLTRHDENRKKRRELIALSAASSVLIVIMWIFYMQYTFTRPNADTNAEGANSASVFKTGLSVIADTVETGLVNSYLYFHTVASEEKTFTITK